MLRKYIFNVHQTSLQAENLTSMSALLTVEPKCTLAASHAALWWVTLSMRRALYLR